MLFIMQLHREKKKIFNILNAINFSLVLKIFFFVLNSHKYGRKLFYISIQKRFQVNT